MRATWLAMTLAACDPMNDLRFDLGLIAAEHPEARFVADLIVDGASTLHLDVAVADGVILERADVIDVRLLYGVAAYADLDGDGACAPHPTDYPWYFLYQPGQGVTFTWTPNPAESPEMAEACSWFGDGVINPGLPGDTGLP